MDKDTHQALLDSVEKWRQIERGEMVDLGRKNCMLCQLFLVRNEDCTGCPVMQKTGEESCRGTPYDQWCKEHGYEEVGSVADTPKLVRLARAERRFLESLLPK